jgi:hypothetical protein
MSSRGDTVLVADIPGRKPIGSAASLMVAANGWNLITLDSVANAVDAMRANPKIRIFVCNEPSVDAFASSRQHSGHIINILSTDLPMGLYCEALGHRDLELIDHVVANFDNEWATADLAITLQKIIRRDFFGIRKYLSPDVTIHERCIKGSRDRDPTNKAVQDFVENCGLGKNLASKAFGISEELLMNAIYDAPVAGGRTHYQEMDRLAERNLPEDEWSTLRYGVDGRVLAISITDPFGAFARSKWFEYLRKALKRDNSETLIDTKKGGAGLGLFKMLYSSHGVVCNVDPGKLTEVIILISINLPVRDFAHTPRSIHYFNTQM